MKIKPNNTFKRLSILKEMDPEIYNHLTTTSFLLGIVVGLCLTGIILLNIYK